MKLTKLILTTAAVVGLAASASAQSVINITGATAFREAAHAAIIASFDSGSLTYGYQGTNIGNAGRAIFSGTINGGDDSVIVRTSWSGSVAGIRAVVNQANTVTYYSTTVSGLTANGTGNLSTSGNNSVSTTANSITFADNTQDNTPFTSVGLLGDPVGVIAFVPVVNETAAVAAGENITTLQLRRLMQSGNVPLQFITGNSSDSGKRVYWTGRQDTSGTRVIYLTEAGLAASAAIQQNRVAPLNNDATNPITSLQLWPTGDATNNSVIWGSDTAGNGGYSSGGALTPLFQRTANTTVQILNAAGTVTSTRNGTDTIILTVISSQDANDIQVGGGKVLAYNGSLIEPTALPTGISATDKNKIARGDYTLWSYEQLFYRDDITDQPTLDFIALLQTNIPASIGGNGVAISDMRVSRAVDGGSLTVLGTLL
jgi:hypothetical protein